MAAEKDPSCVSPGGSGTAVWHRRKEQRALALTAIIRGDSTSGALRGGAWLSQ